MLQGAPYYAAHPGPTPTHDCRSTHTHNQGRLQIVQVLKALNNARLLNVEVRLKAVNKGTHTLACNTCVWGRRGKFVRASVWEWGVQLCVCVCVCVCVCLCVCVRCRCSMQGPQGVHTSTLTWTWCMQTSRKSEYRMAVFLVKRQRLRTTNTAYSCGVD